MKKFFVLLCVPFVGIAHATTVNIDWQMDGLTYAQTTCTVGGDIVLPQTPSKYGYDFLGWEKVENLIEYLESTGTQYIDTGYIPTDTTRLDIKYTVTQLPSSLASGACPIGGRAAWQDRMFGIFSPINSANYNAIFAGNSVVQFSGIALLGKEVTAVIDIPNQRVELNYDGEIHSVNTSIANVKYTYPLYMFKLNSAGVLVDSDAHIRIYYVQIKENDNIIHDFVPALNPRGIPCIYDKITERYFYNSGTGDFVSGPRI